MKVMSCPIHGVRPISEFLYWGECRAVPDAGVTDELWMDYVFNRDGAPGVKKEWWYHIASGTWFIAERDTLSDEVRQTYLFDPNCGK
jgi:sarcosine oxidase subunit delta